MNNDIKNNNPFYTGNEIDFLIAEMGALEGKEPDRHYEFTCPLCGGKAFAHRNSYSLHASARCEHCGGVCHEMYGGCKK